MAINTKKATLETEQGCTIKLKNKGLKLISSLKNVEDFRVARTRLFPLEEVFVSAILAILLTKESCSWNRLAATASNCLPFLRHILPFENGIPSHDTYNRFFNKLPPDTFEFLFKQTTAALFGEKIGKKAHICLDGKQIRGATKAGESTIHLVSAWAHENGLCLRQLKVRDKSNEITVLPEVLSELPIEGNIFTCDAMGTQVNIAAQINENKGFYLLALKGNQPSTEEAAQQICANYEPRSIFKSCDVNRGTVVDRKCEVFTVTKSRMPSMDRWSGLSLIVRVTTSTYNKKTKKTVEDIRLFMTNMSTSTTAKEFNELILHHWSIERDCHWQLDVTFGEDKGKKVAGYAAENFSRLSRLTMNLVNNVDDSSLFNCSSMKSKMECLFIQMLLDQSNLLSFFGYDSKSDLKN